MNNIEHCNFKTLPTTDKSVIYGFKGAVGNDRLHIGMYDSIDPRDNERVNYHLYMVTYDKGFPIRVGDYVMRNGAEILRVSPKLLNAIEEGQIANTNCVRVLATSDRNLDLPQIPEWKIGSYCMVGGEPSAYINTNTNKEIVVTENNEIKLPQQDRRFSRGELLIEMNNYRKFLLDNEDLSEEAMEDYLEKRFFS